MSEDQNTNVSCLTCQSQYKKDRICISKQCDEQYLKYICKMCHYDQHKSQGRLKTSELDIDILKKDIGDLLKNQMDQNQEEEKLYNYSKQIRVKIQESIKCLEKYDKQLEEYQNRYKDSYEKLKNSFEDLDKKDDLELQQSIYSLFEIVKLCESDDNNKTAGFWKVDRSFNKDNLVQVSQICEISNYISRFTDFEKIESISQEIININRNTQDNEQLNQQLSDNKKQINLLNVEYKKQLIINECNKLVQGITKYFTNWFGFDYIKIERLNCTKCQSFYYMIENSYYQNYGKSSNPDLCNNCTPQYRESSDPEGTSTFYYYGHQRNSAWIKTRNAQDLYNYYTKMLEIINNRKELQDKDAQSQEAECFYEIKN
ncbi:hypothetical protein TTHERM_00242530 (macronuclear) [Tetrahymena thermophila SB210]|uniref:Uncharacterized protein n=1 Tax=Tetrahymena thermophila (strain SB210) TaxID=312017 RepID=I7M419_TETTS|nr:hypothetical protein TTHERM_00242530 [Tetrahymena thermophila SB210]EAS04731.4 hypothetical protein TTHERM_00242530 [Tetrahymena thermophila SB210]|eukprot:XP_001024976.4 hypothetical protein TTHERM_00242530 [Tetrahymena thermophila SB210]